MSDASTKTMLAPYIEEAPKPGFFSSMFRTPPENYYNSESVEIDIRRAGQKIAIPIQDLSVKGRINESTLFTNKEFIPPVYTELFPVTALSMMHRRMGRNPFDDIDFMDNAMSDMLRNMRTGQEMIGRSVELQAAQVMQTGTVTLTNETGAALYNISFAPKGSHFANATTTWASSTTKLADLENMANVILSDGRALANTAVFGSTAWNYFLNDAAVQKLLDNKRIDIGAINRPSMREGGGVYHGTISVGQYNLELWTYPGTYEHPQTGVTTPYMDPNKVVVRGDGRLDLTFGAIPQFPPDPQIAALVLGRVTSMPGMDLHTNAWISEDRRTIWGSVAARPLAIPTAIDTFGTITAVYG